MCCPAGLALPLLRGEAHPASPGSLPPRPPRSAARHRPAPRAAQRGRGTAFHVPNVLPCRTRSAASPGRGTSGQQAGAAAPTALCSRPSRVLLGQHNGDVEPPFTSRMCCPPGAAQSLLCVGRSPPRLVPLLTRRCGCRCPSPLRSRLCRSRVSRCRTSRLGFPRRRITRCRSATRRPLAPCRNPRSRILRCRLARWRGSRRHAPCRRVTAQPLQACPVVALHAPGIGGGGVAAAQLGALQLHLGHRRGG